MKKDIIRDTWNLLESNRLGGAISMLRKEMDTQGADASVVAEIRKSLDKISDTYRYMGEYLLSGYEDKGRDSLFARLKEEVLLIAVCLDFASEMETSPEEFFSTFRLGKFSKFSLPGLFEEYRKNLFRIEKAGETDVDATHLVKKNEQLLDSIFRTVWVSPPWVQENTAEIRRVIESEDFDLTVKSQVVSALLLSLLSYYDPEKIAILLDAYGHTSDQRLAARLLTVLLPVINRWKKFVEKSASLVEKLNGIAESLLTYTRLREIVMTLVRTRDTDRVSDEIKKTFDIAMKNLPPDLIERMQREGLGMEEGDIGENPEWNRIMRDSDLEQRFMDINEMQMQGMDVMIESFGRLKNFPFFRDLPHWFLPFDAGRSDIVEALGDSGIESLEDIADVLGICGSDRYSFAFGLASMPADRRAMLLANVGMAREALAEQFGKSKPKEEKSAFARETLLYARDLYRFFKLYPKRDQFFNIFRNPIDFVAIPVLGQLLEEEEILNLIGNFYFEYGYYNLALPLFEKVAANGESDMQLYEKLGYCHQMTGSIDRALSDYERADLFSSDAVPPSIWLLRKLAFCNKILRKYDVAADYYARILERNPDDSAAEVNLGNMLLLGGNIKEGMEHLAKIHYLEPDNPKFRNAYLKGLLMRGDNYPAAYETAKKNLEKSRDAESLLLAAHAAFLAGNFREARGLYSETVEYEGNADRKFFRGKIIDEINFLAPKRFDSIALDIILDSIFLE